MKAYLLAAGHGRRAGGPKAWLEHAGEPLLQRQVEFLTDRFGAANVAVSIQEPWLARCRAMNRAAIWVPVNPDSSPLGSLQVLIQASPIMGWGFVHHVDMPVWHRELFDLLAARTTEAPDCLAVVPTHRERRGHPVALSPALQAKLLQADPLVDRLDLMLQEGGVKTVEVPYPCVLENWNTPAMSR